MVTLRELRGRHPPRRRTPRRDPPQTEDPAPSHNPSDDEFSDTVTESGSCDTRRPRARRHHRHHHTHTHASNLHPYVEVINTFPARTPCAYRYWSDMPRATAYDVVYPPPPPPRYSVYPPPYGPCYAGPSPYVLTCPGSSCPPPPVWPCAPCAPRC